MSPGLIVGEVYGMHIAHFMRYNACVISHPGGGDPGVGTLTIHVVNMVNSPCLWGAKMLVNIQLFPLPGVDY
jgi:hypothetical protein